MKERESRSEEMMDRAHIGPAEDYMANRKMNIRREPIKRTVSRISQRKSRKGKR